MPPEGRTRRAEGLLLETPDHKRSFDVHDHLESFVTQTDRAFDLFANALPELEPLDDAETLTYLHATISTKRHMIRPPETPMYLDAILADCPLTGGLEPMLGDAHLRIMTILSFPGSTTPRILDALNGLGLSYRWCSRFIAMDKPEATKELGKYRRQWFAKRKSVMALLKEVMTNEPSVLVDTDADNKALDADEAWVFLDDPEFAGRLREWLKTLRKKNVSVIFATQSLSDITNSSIAPAIIESCLSRIFLPNERALEPQQRKIYDAFGLNARQAEIISRAMPKREYYFQSRQGNRLFDLNLGPVALAFCAASEKADHQLLTRLSVEMEGTEFVSRYLAAKNLEWAISLINNFQRSET